MSTLRSRILADRIARVVVTAGGLSVVASIVAMLTFMLIQVIPLWQPAKAELGDPRPTPGTAAAWLVDEYLSRGARFDRAGRLELWDLADGRSLGRRAVLADDIEPFQSVRRLDDGGGVAWIGEQVVELLPAAWRVTFEASGRRIEMETQQPRRYAFPAPIRAVAAIADPRIVAQTDDGTLLLADADQAPHPIGVAPPLEGLRMSADGTRLFALATDGTLHAWTLDATAPAEPIPVRAAPPGRRTHLTLLSGDRALALGRDDGRVEIWFQQVTAGSRAMHLEAVRTLDAIDGPILDLEASRRGKEILVAGGAGGVALLHSTTARVLWSAPPGRLDPPSDLVFATKGDGVLFAAKDELRTLRFDIPHPEVAPSTLFARTRYEGARRGRVDLAIERR